MTRHPLVLLVAVLGSIASAAPAALVTARHVRPEPPHAPYAGDDA